MRTRFLTLVAVSLLVSLGLASPARAQGTFYEIDLGRAAVAFWDDHKNETFAFALAGQGMIYNSDAGQPYIGEVGCAAVDNAKKEKAAFGCGELSSFSIDDDLGAASGKGSFDAMTFDFKTGKVTPGGKISFNVKWTAKGDPRPTGGGGFFFDAPAFGFSTGAQIERDASDAVKGRVTGSPLGRGPSSRAVYGAILVGPNIGFELHG